MPRQARFEREQEERKKRYEQERKDTRRRENINLGVSAVGLGIQGAKAYSDYKVGISAIESNKALTAKRNVETENKQYQLDELKKGESYVPMTQEIQSVIQKGIDEVGPETFWNSRVGDYIKSITVENAPGADAQGPPVKMMHYNKMRALANDFFTEDKMKFRRDYKIKALRKHTNDVLTLSAVASNPDKFLNIQNQPQGMQPGDGAYQDQRNERVTQLNAKLKDAGMKMTKAFQGLQGYPEDQRKPIIKDFVRALEIQALKGGGNGMDAPTISRMVDGWLKSKAITPLMGQEILASHAEVKAEIAQRNLTEAENAKKLMTVEKMSQGSREQAFYKVDPTKDPKERALERESKEKISQQNVNDKAEAVANKDLKTRKLAKQKQLVKDMDKFKAEDMDYTALEGKPKEQKVLYDNRKAERSAELDEMFNIPLAKSDAQGGDKGDAVAADIARMVSGGRETTPTTAESTTERKIKPNIPEPTKEVALKKFGLQPFRQPPHLRETVQPFRGR